MTHPTVTPLPGAPTAARQTTAREAVAVLFRRKWLIIGLFVVTTTTVLLMAATTPITYVSSGRVLIRRGEKQSSLLPNREVPNQWEEELGSEVEIIKSWEVHQIAQRILDADGGPKTQFSGAQVDAEVMGKSNVIAIAYVDRNPILAQRAARATMQAYVQFRQQSLTLLYPKVFFDTEIARADSMVRGVIEERRRYADETGVVEPLEQKRAALGLGEILGQRRSEAAADLAAAHAEQETMRKLRTNPFVEDPTTLAMAGGASSAIEELKRRVVEQHAHVLSLQESYRDDTPEVIAARATLDTLRAMLNERVQGQLALADSRVSSLEARLASIDRDITKMQADLHSIPDKEARISELDLKYNLSKERYNDLLLKARNASVNEMTSQPLTMVMLTPPGPGVSRNSRDYVRLALAPAFSLVVGVGLAFFIDGLDLTVRTAGQAEEALDLPVLAAITERRRRARQA